MTESTRPPIRVTHTVAELELSLPAYQEIRDKLVAAGYDHVFDSDLMDMQGIGIVPEETPAPMEKEQRVAVVVPQARSAEAFREMMPEAKVFPLLAPVCSERFDMVVVFGGRPGEATSGGSRMLAKAHSLWFDRIVATRLMPGGRVVFAG